MEEHLQDIKDLAAKELSKTSGPNDFLSIIDAMFIAIAQKSDSWKLIISVMFQPDVGQCAKKLIDDMAMHQLGLYEAYFSTLGAAHPIESAKTVVAVLHGALLSFALSGNNEDFDRIRNNVIADLISHGV